jgi:hypothetical protein
MKMYQAADARSSALPTVQRTKQRIDFRLFSPSMKINQAADATTRRFPPHVLHQAEN